VGALGLGLCCLLGRLLSGFGFLGGLHFGLGCSVSAACVLFSIVSTLIVSPCPCCRRHIHHSGSEKLQLEAAGLRGEASKIAAIGECVAFL
jgi:hypothetical protein